MRLLIDDDSTCSKDRACAQQPDKTHYNTIRPHSALGYRPPAPETTPPQEVLTTLNQAP